MKRRWLLPSLGAFLISSTASAAELQSWNFDVNQNRLDFITNEGVQPRAQMIVNPTRLVIDLPGVTLGRPAIRQSLGRTIRSMRIGQFDNQTTRLVIELASGYTLDPQQVKVQGESPTRWSVQIPQPQLLGLASPPAQLARAPQPSRKPSFNSLTRELPPSNKAFLATASTQIDNVRVTPDGLFINTRGDSPEKVEVTRSRDRQQITIDLKGAALFYRLAGTAFSVNQLGVGRLRATQQTLPPTARFTLEVAKNSPDWQASVSRGGVIVLPKGRVTSPGGLERRASFSLLPASSNQSVQLPARLPQPQGSTTAIAARVDTQRPVILPNRPPRIIRAPIPAPAPAVISQPQQQPLIAPAVPAPAPATALPIGQPPVTRAVVVIDPGHGGPDPGAIGIGGLQEKNVVFPIALEVASLLEKQGVQAVLTRTDDIRDVDLPPRVALAEQVNAAAFVSIHANAINLSRTDISGLETYYYSNGGRLAQIIHANILQGTGTRDRSVRRARFYVLRKTSMPAVLVETGFVTGAEDAPRLGNPDFQRQMAAAIARGILQYLQNR